PAERIDELPVQARIDQRAIVVLAVNFNEAGRDRPQGLGADGLVVDEGACPSIRHLDAAENEFAVRFDVLRPRGDQRRMIRRQIENSGYLALRFAVADKRAVAAGPEAERKGIEQDRLAGARLAGQHSKARPEFEVELIDQHNVADGELNEHAGLWLIE